MKQLVLAVALAGLLVLGYCNRRLLQDQLGTLSDSASQSVEDEKQQPETTSQNVARTKSAEKGPLKKASPANNPAPAPTDSATAEPPPDSPPSLPATPTRERGPYDVTIVGSGFTTGRLPDFGIFRNETVYTVFLEMDQPGGSYPDWILQYAPLRNSAATSHTVVANTSKTLNPLQMGHLVQAPFPVQKEYPQFPAEFVARNPGRMIVVHVVISAEGKVEQARILAGASPLVNQPVLEALQKWSFRPAEVNGERVAVKSLLGIVLPEAL